MHLISRGHHHHPSRRNLSCLCTYLQSYTFTRHQEYYPKQNEILKRKTRLCFSLWICINGMLWLSKTAQICLYARFNNGDVDIVHCHDNAACELLPEFLNALSSNDSTGAPVICFHINSQVGEMVLNAQAEHRDAPAALRVFTTIITNLFSCVAFGIMDPYLSWEMVVCQLGKKGEIRRQMWHDIMSVCHSNCVGHIFGKVWGKRSIANTRLPERHELHTVTSKFHLCRNVLLKLSSRIRIQKDLRECSMNL